MQSSSSYYALGNGSSNTTSAPMMEQFPSVVNMINTIKNVPMNTAPTAIEEINRIFSALSLDQRVIVESNEQYIETKAEIFQEFLLWSIAATDLGKAYLSGPGAEKSKKLLAIVENLSKEVSHSTSNKIKDLEETVKKQSETMNEQAKIIQQLNEFRKQFIDDTKVEGN